MWINPPTDEGLPQSGTGQARLVLVVPEVCAGGYGAGRVRAGSARRQERLMGRSAASAAVGVAEEDGAVSGRA